MAKLTFPVTMKVTAKETAFRFIPYKENFTTTVPAGKSLSLGAYTLGQYLYYIKQGFEASTQKADIVIPAPASITIKNTAAKVMSFVPYRENFQADLAVGESLEFDVKTAGQVLYYVAQDSTGDSTEGAGIDVTFAETATESASIEE